MVIYRALCGKGNAFPVKLVFCSLQTVADGYLWENPEFIEGCKMAFFEKKFRSQVCKR